MLPEMQCLNIYSSRSNAFPLYSHMIGKILDYSTINWIMFQVSTLYNYPIRLMKNSYFYFNREAKVRVR